MSDSAETDGGVGTSDGEGAAGTQPEEPSADESDDTYRGVFSAFPYAFRSSESRLFKSYAVVGGLVAVVVVLLFTFGLVELLSDTAGAAGGTFTFSRAFFIVLMVLVVAPLIAPVLFVARRHRRRGSDRRYDRLLAATGYLFVVALYVGLAISVPPALQEDSPGAVGSFLYSLPRASGAVPPVLGAVLIYAVHRLYR